VRTLRDGDMIVLVTLQIALQMMWTQLAEE
jgi:hypothetical protein